MQKARVVPPQRMLELTTCLENRAKAQLTAAMQRERDAGLVSAVEALSLARHLDEERRGLEARTEPLLE